MMLPILFGVGEVAFNVFVQTLTVIHILGRLVKYERNPLPKDNFFAHFQRLASIMVILFLGHIVQILAWAIPFRVFLAQFENMKTAFYFSAVNYTSLGYGDIVIANENWRILGPLEAANGVLMFGVSTATFFAIMSAQIRQHRRMLGKHLADEDGKHG